MQSKSADRLRNQRIEMGWAKHVSPFSTLIAAMGNHWQPSCYEALEAMAEYTWSKGIELCLYEEPDRCYQPFDALGVMRNAAYMRALREGYEFILYVDNDVCPQPGVLYQLLNRFMPIISPIIVYADGNDHGLTMPKIEQGKGLAMVSSCVLSMVLIQTSVFAPWAIIPFWQDALGADEAYHFSRLAVAGHRPFVDTDVVVTCVSPPHYPLDERP